MKLHYKAIKVNGRKKDLHRHLMEQKLGRKLHFDEVVHHIDENKLNNDLSNLEIKTRSEHSRGHKTNSTVKETTKEKLRIAHRETRPAAKLSIEDVRRVKQLLNSGVSGASIGKMFGVCRTSISSINTGKTYSWVL